MTSYDDLVRNTNPFGSRVGNQAETTIEEIKQRMAQARAERLAALQERAAINNRGQGGSFSPPSGPIPPGLQPQSGQGLFPAQQRSADFDVESAQPGLGERLSGTLGRMGEAVNSWRNTFPYSLLGGDEGIAMQHANRLAGRNQEEKTKGIFKVKRGEDRTSAPGQRQKRAQTQGPPEFGASLEDYLAAADPSRFSSAAMSDIAAREAALRQQASFGDAELAKMYAALVNNYQSQVPQIQQQYSQAQGATQQNNEAAAALINSNALASQGVLDETAQNTDGQAALPIAAQYGGGTEQANAVNLGNLASQGQLSVQALIDASQRGQNFSRNMGGAVGLRGVQERGQMQNDLLAMLAALQDQRTSAQSDAQQQALQLAMQKYDADYSQFRDQRDYTTSRDDTAYNRAMQQAELKLGQKGPGAQMEPVGYQLMSARLRQSRVPEDVIAAFERAVVDTQVNAQRGDPAGDYLTQVGNALVRQGVDPRYIPLLKSEAGEYFNAYRS